MFGFLSEFWDFLKELEDKDAPMPRDKEAALNIATS